MKSLVTITVLAAALLGGLPAWGQGLDPNSDDPVDISADEAEVQNKTCVSIWRGKAEALQGKARLRADVLKAFMKPKAGAAGGTGTGACGALLRLEATGSVYYVTAKDERVRGDAGTYDAESESVVLTGDVVAVQGQNVLRGTKMTFNTQTGEGHMAGSGGGSRPRGVFYPAKKDPAKKDGDQQPGAPK
jgi:lipopolysaccharide export system protein LptA